MKKYYFILFFLLMCIISPIVLSASSTFTYRGSVGSYISPGGMTECNGSVYVINESGGVYRYSSGTTWNNIGTVSNGWSLFEFENHLYAGTYGNPAKIYRYNGTTWLEVGSIEDSYSNLDNFFELGSKLYVINSYQGPNVKVYRYDSDGVWTSVFSDLASSASSPKVQGGYVYLGLRPSGLKKYDGADWTSIVAGELGAVEYYSGSIYARGYANGSWEEQVIFRESEQSLITSLSGIDPFFGGVYYPLISDGTNLYVAPSSLDDVNFYFYVFNGVSWEEESISEEIYGSAALLYSGNVWFGGEDGKVYSLVYESYYCGDETCNGEETVSTCPTDCQSALDYFTISSVNQTEPGQVQLTLLSDGLLSDGEIWYEQSSYGTVNLVYGGTSTPITFTWLTNPQNSLGHWEANIELLQEGTYTITGDQISSNYTIEVAINKVCGDGTCNGTETCETCKVDCGECAKKVCLPYTQFYQNKTVNLNYGLLTTDQDKSDILTYDFRMVYYQSQKITDPTGGKVVVDFGGYKYILANYDMFASVWGQSDSRITEGKTMECSTGAYSSVCYKYNGWINTDLYIKFTSDLNYLNGKSLTEIHNEHWYGTPKQATISFITNGTSAGDAQAVLFSACVTEVSKLCGDGICNEGENISCSQDCPVSCGDTYCNGTETCATCEIDCGACLPTCGNGVCEEGENISCPQDCPTSQCLSCMSTHFNSPVTDVSMYVCPIKLPLLGWTWNPLGANYPDECIYDCGCSDTPIDMNECMMEGADPETCTCPEGYKLLVKYYNSMTAMCVAKTIPENDTCDTTPVIIDNVARSNRPNIGQICDKNSYGDMVYYGDKSDWECEGNTWTIDCTQLDESYYCSDRDPDKSCVCPQGKMKVGQKADINDLHASFYYCVDKLYASTCDNPMPVCKDECLSDSYTRVDCVGKCYGFYPSGGEYITGYSDIWIVNCQDSDLCNECAVERTEETVWSFTCPIYYQGEYVDPNPYDATPAYPTACLNLCQCNTGEPITACEKCLDEQGLSYTDWYDCPTYEDGALIDPYPSNGADMYPTICMNVCGCSPYFDDPFKDVEGVPITVNITSQCGFVFPYFELNIPDSSNYGYGMILDGTTTYDFATYTKSGGKITIIYPKVPTGTISYTGFDGTCMKDGTINVSEGGVYNIALTEPEKEPEPIEEEEGNEGNEIIETIISYGGGAGEVLASVGGFLISTITMFGYVIPWWMIILAILAMVVIIWMVSRK